MNQKFSERDDYFGILAKHVSNFSAVTEVIEHLISYEIKS